MDMYESMIDYEEVLEYKPEKPKVKPFESIVKKDLASQVYQPSKAIEQVKQFCPSNTLSILSDLKDKLDSTLSTMDKALATVSGDGITFSDYKKALESGDTNTVNAFENAHANDVEGNPMAELYSSLYNAKQEVTDLQDLVAISNYGSKDIGLDNAKATDTVLINQLVEMEEKAIMDSKKTVTDNINIGNKTFTLPKVSDTVDSVDIMKQDALDRDLILSKATLPKDTEFSMDDIKVQNKQQAYKSKSKTIVSNPVSNTSKPTFSNDIDLQGTIASLINGGSTPSSSVGVNKNINYSAMYFDVQVNKSISDKASNLFIYANKVQSVVASTKATQLPTETANNPAISKIIQDNFSRLAKSSMDDKQKLSRLGSPNLKLAMTIKAIKSRNDVVNVMSTINDLNKISDLKLKNNLLAHIGNTLYESKQAILDLYKLNKLEEMYRSDYIESVGNKQSVRNFHRGYSS